MDFLSIRKKARERAEARAREAAAARPPAAATEAPAPAPEPAVAIEEELRAELLRIQDGRAPGPPGGPVPRSGDAPAPPAPAAPALAPAEAAPAPAHAAPGTAPVRAAPAPAPAAPAPPADPLDDFFWREDESAPAVPDLGLGAGSAAAEAPAERRREFVAFLLGDEEYGIPIERVREILRPPPVTEVPRAPPPIVGVITLRGEVVALLDPRPGLALPPAAAGPRSRLVVCESPDGPVGLLVDAVSQVVRLREGAIEPRPPGIAGAGAGPIAGIGREGRRLVILLDLDRLLPRAAPAQEGAR